MAEPVLDVKNLRCTFHTYDGEVQAVRGVSFSVMEGESLGIVGESGCGKSVSMLSVMGLMDKNGKKEADSITFNHRDILHISDKEMRKIDGYELSMIFQDPMTSLNPVFTIQQQMTDPIIRHLHLNRQDAIARALHMLEIVGIPDPKQRLKQYPHQLSGGLRQRVMIAIAMSCNPKLLIADEPTTALDVTIQAQILELMARMQKEYHMAEIMISHDLGVISTLSRRVIVMYGGIIVEEGLTDEIFYSTAHPYTAGLLGSIPGEDGHKLIPINGTPPDLLNPPAGCPFAPRCKYAMKLCEQAMPPRFDFSDTHYCACWLHHPSVEARKGKVVLI